MNNEQGPFVKEICEYVASRSGGIFTYGTNLMIGELVRDTDGIYAISVPPIAPDAETAVEYHQIDFWSRNKNSEQGFQNLRAIYTFLHQKHDYETDNFYIYRSWAVGQIDDMDRDLENGKLWRFSVLFMTRYLIS